MFRRLRPGARAAAGALVFTALLASTTGCGAGFDAATGRPYTPTDGVNGEAGDILLRSISLVAAEPGGPAAVVGAVVNESGHSDRLVGVQVAGASEPAYFPDEQIFLPRGDLVPLGTDGTPAVTVTGPPSRLQPGSFVRVRFFFARGGATTLQVLVQPQAGDYATVTPTPSPTEEPTGKSRSGEQTPTPDESPTS